MKNIKSIIFNSESFKFDDSNYAKLDNYNTFTQAVETLRHVSINSLNDRSYIIFNGYDNTVKPQDSVQTFIVCTKNNSIRASDNPCFIGFQYANNGNSSIFLRTRRTLDRHNDESSYGITVEYDYNSDTFYTMAITPNNNSYSTDIATTKWVRDLLIRNGYNLNS